MNIDITFETVANCLVYSKDNSDQIGEESIKLTFNEYTAKRFLLRFYEPSVEVSGYKLLFKYNGSKIEGIILYKDELIYIVKNPNEVINEVYDSFINTSTLLKVNDVLSFDFDAANILKNEVEE